jgi:hypothetical protein
MFFNLPSGTPSSSFRFQTDVKFLSLNAFVVADINIVVVLTLFLQANLMTYLGARFSKALQREINPKDEDV